jgi:hypothetical protein
MSVVQRERLNREAACRAGKEVRGSGNIVCCSARAQQVFSSLQREEEIPLFRGGRARTYHHYGTFLA